MPAFSNTYRKVTEWLDIIYFAINYETVGKLVSGLLIMPYTVTHTRTHRND